MKIKVLTGVCLGNGKDALPGEVHEVADGLARELIYSGRAKPVPEKAAAKDAAA